MKQMYNYWRNNFYVLEGTNSQPNNTLINTYIGKPNNSSSANPFVNTIGSSLVLPRLYKDGTSESQSDLLLLQ